MYHLNKTNIWWWIRQDTYGCIVWKLKVSDPEELVISREEIGCIQNEMEEVLSALEMEVLMSYIDGKIYTRK